MKCQTIFFIFFAASLLQNVFLQSDTVSCTYSNDDTFGYTCELTLINPNGRDDFTRIDGSHLSGRYNGDVRRIVRGSHSYSVNFPSILCQKFYNTNRIDAYTIGIRLITANSFRNCKRLEYLSLYNNQISEITYDAFINNAKLNFFILAGNELNKLPENVFEPLSNLRTLYLQYNNLHEISSSLFTSLINLELLHLYENNLTILPGDTFNTQTKLRDLAISHNNLTEVNPKWFANLTSLEVLYLNSNNFKTLPANSFTNLQSLWLLYMHVNKIEEFPPNLFVPLVNLVHLYIDNNNLKVIHSDSFGSLTSLQDFWFHHNQIDEIDERLIDNTGIVAIDGSFNPCIDRNEVIRDDEIREALQRCFDNYEEREVTMTTTAMTTTTEEPEECEIGGLDERVCQLEWDTQGLRDEKQEMRLEIENLSARLKVLEEKILELSTQPCRTIK